MKTGGSAFLEALLNKAVLWSRPAPVASLKGPCVRCVFANIYPDSPAQPNINGFASPDAPLPPSLKGTPHHPIRRKGLHPAPGHVNEGAVVGDRAMPEQPCQECQRMVGERRIYERLLPLSQRFFSMFDLSKSSVSASGPGATRSYP